MLPVVDIRALISQSDDRDHVAREIGDACRDWGFFYVVGHGVDPRLIRELEEASRRFFAQDLEKKLDIKMAHGGRAWRGYFPVGDELTSGYPDAKEGIYFGAELNDDDPRVKAGTPLHGKNLFPDGMPEFRKNVLDYMAAMTELGHRLMAAIALALGLEETYFADHYTGDPLTLFRIFNYPPAVSNLGVGEHTDYGLLTILWQDSAGGLQIKRGSTWVDAAPIPDSFVCNIGDMLDRLTKGQYRSTPHRARNVSGRGRLSFPFFFDPDFDARMLPVEGLVNEALKDDSAERWDHASVHDYSGTYGSYLLSKVSKVFPELRDEVL